MMSPKHLTQVRCLPLLPNLDLESSTQWCVTGVEYLAAAKGAMVRFHYFPPMNININGYTQCKLRNKDRIDIAWLPNGFAKVGRVLRIKIDGKWQEDWVVLEVFSSALEYETIERSKDYRKISTFMPK